jgi:hypothetical protein
VRVELRPPPHFKGLQAEPVHLPAGTDRGVLEIRFDPHSGPFNLPCPVHATTLDTKTPHTAEAFIEFVRPAVARSTVRE